jgi:hypothetical protein
MSAANSPRRRRFIAALALAAAAPALAQDPAASAAQSAAREWLALTDALDGKTAWERAAAKFRSSMAIDVWSAALRKERGPRGATARRAVMHTDFRREIPGYPPGDYALVVFRTAFANAESQESVTLEREPDGVWRVVGYLIR